ncbi:MAG: hypothetical protein HQ557_16820 [Bacteroidetes bacterium]|nr:hypothetical protein [Bacteroidota bacterium]
MKRLLVSMLLVLSCAALFSQTPEMSTKSLETSRSMFSLVHNNRGQNLKKQ